MQQDELDYEQLEAYFRALAFSSRLELLHILRLPHALGEIRLTSRRSRAGENPDRVISRQSMQEHLEQLVDIGVVVEELDHRGRKEFTVNGPRLYQIVEEFRRLVTVFAGNVPRLGETAPADGAPMARAEDGPHLALVHGMVRGKTFPLRRGELNEGGRGWVLGRKRGLHVSLDYDPFVSLENSEIIPDGNEYVLTDLRSSRNGTFLNWRRLGRDERVALRPGDVIDVGRSSLVFRRG